MIGLNFLFMGIIVGGLPVLYRRSTSTGKSFIAIFLLGRAERMD
jgi:hypothetical protein